MAAEQAQSTEAGAMTRHTILLSGAGLAMTALAVALTAGHPAAQQPPLASRIVPTDATTYRPLTAVHAGAGNMAFVALLNRGAIGPHFNFLHRGEIPSRSGIGHHFHNTVEEMFVILNGEGQFTVNGRTARIQGPAAVVCRMGDSHALLNTGSETLQWMNFQASSVARASAMPSTWATTASAPPSIRCRPSSAPASTAH